MECDDERPVTRPGDVPGDWVDAHVAAAERLIRQSHQAVDRVTERVQQTHRRVQRTYQQVQDLAGAAELTHRATAGAADRFLQVKQRELAAHLAAVELHEQAAELQERLGNRERANQARIHAEQARALHRLAAEELADYQARIAAADHNAGKPPG
jgi:flagellar motility protein MotE (MotC chaperone)